VGFVEVDNLRIRIAILGEGTPLLLIMGLGGHHGLWRPLQDRLSDFETVAFAVPGAGYSSTPRSPLRLRQLARVVIHVLDALGYQQVDLMGVSYGGALAQEVTRRAPDRIRRLVLAATAYGIGSIPGNPLAMLKVVSPASHYSRALFTLQAPFVFGGQFRHDRDLARRAWASWHARPPSLVGYLSQLYGLVGWSSLWWLHSITQPTLVLSGDDDPLVPPINGKILAARIPNAQLQIIPGGHFFLMERPDQVAHLVRDFLTGES
jgi:poly(3-hydroxyalkanoate) depolymerase